MTGPVSWIFFCGSGTTAAVAERLGRRYIAADNTWRAIHTTRKRLTAMGAKPFKIFKHTKVDLHMKKFSPHYQVSLDEKTVTLDTKNLVSPPSKGPVHSGDQAG